MEVGRPPTVQFFAHEQPPELRENYERDSPTAQLVWENTLMGAAPSQEMQGKGSGHPRGSERDEEIAGLRNAALRSRSSRGILKRPAQVNDEITSASARRTSSCDDLYDIPSSPEKSTKPTSARLPTNLGRRQAAVMLGLRVSQADQRVDTIGKGLDTHPLPVNDSAELKQVRKVTRIQPERAEKQDERSEQSTASRRARPHLRSDGKLAGSEPVDWGRKPEAKKKRAGPVSKNRHASNDNLMEGRVATESHTRKAKANTGDSKSKATRVQSDDDQERHNSYGSKDENSKEFESADQLASSEADRNLPASAQSQNDIEDTPAGEMQQNLESDHTQPNEHLGVQQPNEDQTNSEPVDDEQDESPDEDQSQSDGESDGSVSSMIVPTEGLFGQEEQFNTITKGLKRIGFQREKQKVTKHKIKLNSKIVKDIVELAIKAIEFRAELTASSSEDEEASDLKHKKYRRQIRAIQKKVESLEKGTNAAKNQKTIEDMYAHGIPTLVKLFFEQIHCHRDTEVVSTPVLHDDILIISVIIELEAKARKWSPRPAPHLTLVKPVANLILPPLREIQEVFRQVLRERKFVIRAERLRLKNERKERQRVAEEKRKWEELLHQIQIERKERDAEAKRRIEEEDPRVIYQKKRRIDISSQAISSNSTFARQGTTHKHREPPEGRLDGFDWNGKELSALLRGLVRFQGPNRYEMIAKTYGSSRIPLADRVEDRPLANYSLQEIIDRASKPDIVESVKKIRRGETGEGYTARHGTQQNPLLVEEH